MKIICSNCLRRQFQLPQEDTEAQRGLGHAGSGQQPWSQIPELLCPAQALLLVLPQQGPSELRLAFVLPLLCQLGWVNTMNRGCDTQQIKLLIDWEAAEKSCFHGLGISSVLLSAERGRERGDPCPEKFFLRRMCFEIGYDISCRCAFDCLEGAYNDAVLSECVVMIP